ncbi:MT-A70 family methyltransferase [Agrobacterium rosae]|uniref:MT-A70 family methyltransferase n=1 Tax=Agrobacterium rosae TaxID=1972867 RepID=UPI003BA32B32
MAAQNYPMIGPTGLGIVAAAVRDGEFHCKSHNDRLSAASAMAHRYLTRDAKDSNLFRPGENAHGLIERAQSEGKLPEENNARIVVSGPYQLLPPLSDDDFRSLYDDIATHGVKVPVEYDDAGEILDGHHRVAICKMLGITDWPRFVRKGLSEDGKRSFARSLNFARRHLSGAQRQEIIQAHLKDAPTASNRAIAKQLGVDHKTVSAARRRLVDGGEIPHHETIVGRDGVAQPIAKPIRTMFLPESANFKEMKTVVKLKRAEDQKIRHAVRSDLAVQIAARQNAAPWWQSVGQDEGKAYPVIYADPPWRFKTYSEVTGGEKGAENHYPTMTLEDIQALGCPGAHNSVLFMWVTDLANGIKTMERWGYAYKSFWVWKKIYEGAQTGTGYWSFDNAELLLIGTRGDFPAPIPGTQPVKCMDHPVAGHSQKPVWYAEQLEHLYPNMPKLEMFQRKDSLADGDIRLNGKWDFWGNQAGSPEGGAE